MSNTNKVLLLLIFVILLALEYVYLTRMHTSKEPTSFTPSFDLSSENCQLSMAQSDGWFCDPDSDWKRRKAIHYAQDQRNHASDERYLFFQNNWEPTVHCAFERRIGKVGDGGKWICDIHRFKESTDSSILVYSFGSNDDFSFEVAVKKNLPEAEIHTFDMGFYECPTDICTYHRTRIGNGRDGRSQSLQMIMEKLGHEQRQIHILKVDIEGSEYDLFEELFSRTKKRRKPIPYIRQILFEIHLENEYDIEVVQRVHRLFQLFRVNNYAIFHKEPNLFNADSCFEYGMIRLNPAFFGP